MFFGALSGMQHYCIDCGAVISKGSKRCQICCYYDCRIDDFCHYEDCQIWEGKNAQED